MPIYEYKSMNANISCKKCFNTFEIIQKVTDRPLASCPECGGPVKKVISRCRAVVVEVPEEHSRVMRKIEDYEKQGMWSHAAELADKHSEKAGDKTAKMRALDNYQKAGYDADTLQKHLESGDT